MNSGYGAKGRPGKSLGGGRKGGPLKSLAVKYPGGTARLIAGGGGGNGSGQLIMGLLGSSAKRGPLGTLSWGTGGGMKPGPAASNSVGEMGTVEFPGLLLE